MITIDQLLESVDLDFEPRFVTKDEDGNVDIWSDKPYRRNTDWDCELITARFATYDHLKLSEFDGKDWTECIYEVSRNTTGKIEQISLPVLVDEQIKDPFSRDIWIHTIVDKIAELVNAVNEINENYACITALTDIRKRLDTLEKCVKNKRGEE